MRGFRRFRRRFGPTAVAVILEVAAGAGLLGCGIGQREAPKTTAQAKKKAPATKIAPPTPIEIKRVELGGPTWQPGWDRMIERSLPHAMLTSRVPRDVQRFCPRFYRMSKTNKREFWAYFFQSLAAAEAGLNPDADVRHTQPQVAVRDQVTGKMVHSEGLLQLAYEDAKRYGCRFNWQADRKLPPRDPARTILNPVNNLKCGIQILSWQLIVQHKPLLSPTGYWSTLHPGTPGYRVFEKQIANAPAACRAPSYELAEHRKSASPAQPANQVAATVANGKNGTGNGARR